MPLFPKLRSKLRNSTSQEDADLNRRTAKKMDDLYEKVSKNPKTWLDKENIEESKEAMEEAGEKVRLWGKTRK